MSFFSNKTQTIHKFGCDMVKIKQRDSYLTEYHFIATTVDERLQMVGVIRRTV